MEILTYARELAQSGAEYLASYKMGQSALRHLDRVLWVVEKCARWAVPPPLDADSPQPELVRPLPWVFFLALLVTLRVARETISLVNLVLGKPPLRSADVVTYIQSKRRYLRTLKYQGNRITRARSSAAAQSHAPWYRGIWSLFEFTMCFKSSHNYGNNNTTHLSHNDEVLIVKSTKRRDPSSPTPSTSETTMERLIEKMMVDLDADSDDDSSFTLTNATSVRSDSVSECDEDTITTQDETLTTANDTTQDNVMEKNIAESGVASSTFEDTHSEGTMASSTPKKNGDNESPSKNNENESPKKNGEYESPNKSAENESPHPNNVTTPPPQENHTDVKEVEEHEEHGAMNKSDLSEPTKPEQETKDASNVDSALGESPTVLSPKQASKNFIQGEKFSPKKTQPATKNTRVGTQRRNSEVNSEQAM